MLALCDHLRIPSAAVVGLSMGGYAAFELLAARPEFVRALVLCDTRATADTPEAAAKRETFAGEALERGVGWVADQLLPKLLGPHAEPRLQNLVRGMIGQATPAAVADAQFAMAARRDATELLPSITCPTLVVVGSEDALTPPSDARAMAAAIPHARLVELHGAGHLSNLEARVGFNRAMRDFLDHLRRRRRRPLRHRPRLRRRHRQGDREVLLEQLARRDLRLGHLRHGVPPPRARVQADGDGAVRVGRRRRRDRQDLPPLPLARRGGAPSPGHVMPRTA